MASGKAGVQNTLRLVFGLAVMLLGLLLTLDNFGLLPVHRLILVWPVLLIALGLAKLFYARRPAARPAAFFFMFLGIGLLLHNFGLLQFRQLVAVFLLALGAMIVWRTARSPAPAAPTLDPGKHLDIVALLGGIQRTVGAQDFQGGSASAVMGGCEIDLTRASIADGEVVINTFAFWGGIDIKVPADWRVDMQGVALLGGFADSTRPPDDDRKKLIVTGYALMGGVEVHN